MALVPSKTAFTVVPSGGVMDTFVDPDEVPPTYDHALSDAAAALTAGESVEFIATNHQLLSSVNYDSGSSGGYEFVAWNNYFHWDELRQEAQAIGLGVGFSPVKHGFYRADVNTWYRVPAYRPQEYWGAGITGHAFSMHVMSPDGTYWMQRSNSATLQYRRRSDWSETPWPLANQTPSFGTGSIYASYAWHDALSVAIYRSGATVKTLDLLGFLSTGTLTTVSVAGLPAYTGDYHATRYCKGLNAAIAFGKNHDGATDGCSMIRDNGSGVAALTTLTNGPPVTVLHGLIGTPLPSANYGLFIDDPDKATAYLLGMDGTLWQMANDGTDWDGTWTDIGTHDAFTKPRSDGVARGQNFVMGAPIYGHGVAWIWTQTGTGYLDSFLWKPPA